MPATQHATSKKTLADILLPGTPESVAKAYASLPVRAQTARFGLLEDEVVVLDTETTGLSFKTCSLIEISAAKLQGNTVVERFDTFVNPNSPIPPEITQLTGISAIDVADAPSAEEAVASLARFTGGLPVLAHNASFDRTFIEKVRGGAEVSDIWIDTLALSRIALPRLSSHKLADMAEAFGCDAVTHRASADVDALCGMWRIMLTALSDLPSGLVAQLATMHEDVDWSYRPILAQIAAAGSGSRFSMKAHRKQMLDAREATPHADAASLASALASPTRAEVEEEFAREGAIGRMYERFEKRPEQMAMALEVRDALATSTSRAIEAGTGVGKSVAYLLPAIQFAKQNNVTVGVATKTNALTDQLVSHELPALDKALPQGVSFTSLKGYDHYPCLSKVERAMYAELPIALVPSDGRSDNAIAQDMLTAIATVSAYASQSPEGELDGLGIRWRYVPRSLLTTTSSECLRTRCPFFTNECLVHGARRRASESDIVVTNHSLLLRDVAAEGRILPPIRHWVIDEAHGFEAEARRQWAHESSGEALRTHFEQLGGTKTGVLRLLIAELAQGEEGTLYTRLLTKVAASAARAQIACADLFETVHELAPLAFKNNAYDTATLWIGHEVRGNEGWLRVVEQGSTAVFALNELAQFAEEAAKSIGEAMPQLGADLLDATRFASENAFTIGLICAGDDDSYVYSAILARTHKRISVEKLCAEKVDVGADLSTRWMPEMHSVVYTSATIAVGESFEHFEHAVGLDALEPGSHKSVKLDSSFDFDANMAVLVPTNMPDPSSREYLQALEELLFDIHVSMEGSVLTLFTNRREMEQVFSRLAPRLLEKGLDLACQEKGSSPRRLRDRFLAEKNLSLLALKSFWEGFDAAGDTLRCVVIPRLPFASPTDPLVKERERRDERAWWHYSLPEAVLEVKQAAGRLIRTADDAGVLVLADARVSTKRYGKTFVDSMPSRNVTRLDAQNVGRYIEMWRASHKR